MLATGDAAMARKLHDQISWLREKAAETDIDRFRWLMDGLADELEQIAETLEAGGLGAKVSAIDELQHPEPKAGGRGH